MKLRTFKPVLPTTDLFFPYPGKLFNSLFSDANMDAVMDERPDFKPGANIVETDAAFEIHMALPGMKKEEVKIDLDDRTLTISGERKLNREENKGTWHYTEIREGKFMRSFSLPETVNQENIEANFRDGMLEIVLPKAEPRQVKTIEIK